MKKYLYILTLLSMCSVFASSAEAKFYLGFDGNYQQINIKTHPAELTSGLTNLDSPSSRYFREKKSSYDTQNFSPNVFLGYKTNKNILFELGFSHNRSKKQYNTKIRVDQCGDEITQENMLSPTIISFDVKPYFNVNKKTSVYGIIGANYYKIDYTGTAQPEGGRSVNCNNDKKYLNGTRSYATIQRLAPTIGFGAEFRMGPVFFARAQFKYSYINKPIITATETRNGQAYGNTWGKLDLRSVINTGIGIGVYF